MGFRIENIGFFLSINRRSQKSKALIGVGLSQIKLEC